MSAINEASIARAKEAIASGKKLEASEPAPKPAKDTTAKGAKASGKGAPAKGGKPVSDSSDVKTKKAAAKADAEAKKVTREAKEREKAAEKANKAAAYAAKIEEQKAAKIKRHRDEKLFNSFRARVKYMLYMDNPALGGLEGRENLGWVLNYTNSAGDVYTVERAGDRVRVVGGIVGESGLKPVEADVLAAMEPWTA